MTGVRHPVFARLLAHRRELLAGPTGRVPDQVAALRELHRVLKPGGELRFYEHVVSPDHGRARLQRALARTGAWARVAGGCHPARDTLAAIEAAGFEIERYRRLTIAPCLVTPPVAPHVLGVARRPA